MTAEKAAVQLPFYKLAYDLSDLNSYCSQKKSYDEKIFYGAGEMAQ